METLSFDEFAEFIREWARLSPKKQVVPETKFEVDLGIGGDDGCELLEATERRFNVILCSEEVYRQTFNLGPNEFLFHSEGLFGRWLDDLRARFGRPALKIRTFTVGELYSAVQKALTRKPSLPSN